MRTDCISLGWIALMLQIGCASVPETPASLDTPRPVVLGDSQAFKRETELSPSREVHLPELGVTFRVPTAAPIEHVRGETFDAVLFDIGTEVPVTCYLHHQRQQLANFLAYQPVNAQGLLVEDLEQIPQVAHVGTGAEAGHAFLTLHWVHPRDGRFGVVKQAAANVYRYTIYCNHPEPGYEETFERAFRTLLSTFLSQEAVEPYYAEIVSIRIGHRPIGIEVTEMRRAFDGRSRIDFSQAILLPRGPAALVATDSHDISFSSESGDLMRQRAIQVQAGVLATNLVLQGVGPGKWRVTGLFEAKDFDQAFEVSDALRSPLGVALDMRDVLIRDGSQAKLDYSTWLPDDDPAGASRVHVEVTGLQDEGFYTGLQSFGEQRRELVLDSDGSLVRGAREEGPATLHMERIWVAGSY